MQNKGFVKVFSVLLTLVCLFYLSFSFVTNRYNKKAAEYAGGDPVKESLYLDSLSTEKVWLGYTLKECREMEIGLGLDLKGGMNVVLELSVPDVIRSLANNNPDENFNKALDLAYAHQATSQKNFIDLFADEYKALDSNARLASIFSTFELKDKITPQSSDAQVIAVLKEEVQSAIDNSFNVLRTRIDRFGVVAPNIQRLETAGRILVELPGVKEPERVRKLLQGSANLEFWETYKLPEIYQQLVAADAALANVLAANQADSTATASAEVVDSTAVAATPTNETDSLLAKIQDNPEAAAQDQSAEEFAKQHPLFAVLQINQYNGQLAPSAVVGYAKATDMAKINEYLSMKQVKDALPRNLSLKWGVKAMDERGMFYELYALKVTNRDGSPALGGDVVTDANADFNQQPGRTEQVVSMEMNAEGAKAWARLTKENIGRSIAIVLDGMVYSAPNVQGEITGGQSSITGNFTPEEAKDLANVLKSGKMAASVHIVQEDVVGPSLGQQSINQGLISFVVALIALMTYLCLMYGFVPGMVANTALVLNFFFTMGIMSSFQAALTLSGIAGIVLSLAMAVDANVLIHERTKEELKAGKNMKEAISAGYSGAFSAIFDSNLTSIITGVILFYFGTGPIRGFATTLIIGIICSFFTAVYMTRLIYEHFLSKGKLRNLTFSTSLSKNLFQNAHYNFMGITKRSFTIWGTIIVICIISFAVRGLSQSIDFTGGRNFVVQFDKVVQPETVRDLLENSVEDANIQAIALGTDGHRIRVSTNYRIEEDGAHVDTEIEGILYEAFKEGNLIPEGLTLAQFIDRDNTEGCSIISSQKVGPSMADDMRTSAIWAVVFAVIAIGLYILIRFYNIAFSLGATVALAIDAFLVVGAYSLCYGWMPFSLEVDQTFIGAVLTVIGYSINDKVVIFDRVREFTHLYPNRNRTQLFNDALNTTLARTLNTGQSTLIVLLIIFFLGGDSIRSFSFAMILGVVIGTFSSLFVAAPVAYLALGGSGSGSLSGFGRQER